MNQAGCGDQGSFPRTAPDDAWDDLRWHLEAMAGLPTVVVLGFESTVDRDDLWRRAQALAHQLAMPVTHRTAVGFAVWAADHLPLAGLLWLDLTGASPDDARATLAGLNELRGRLHRPESGVLVVAASWPVVAEMARYAGDFWSVMSFARRVARPAVPYVFSFDLEQLRWVDRGGPERPPVLRGGRLRFEALPVSYRSGETSRLVKHLQHALSLSDDADEDANVARLLEDAALPDNPFEVLLVETVRAAVLADSDPTAAVEAARKALDALQRLRPQNQDVLVLERVVREVLLGPCGPSVVLPFDLFAADLARDLAETGPPESGWDVTPLSDDCLGTAENVDNLATALENVAQVAMVTDLPRALQAFDEFSRLRRELWRTDQHLGHLITVAEVGIYLSEAVAQAGDLSGAVDLCQRLQADWEHDLAPLDHPVFTAIRGFEDYWKVRASTGNPSELRQLVDRETRFGRLIRTSHLVPLRFQLGAASAAETAEALADLLVNQTRLLGNDHSATLGTRLNLAALRGIEGDPAGAVADLTPLLSDMERVLGPEAIETLHCRFDLAVARGAAWAPQEAITELERLLADQVRLMGPDHPDAARTRDAVARFRIETSPTTDQ